jgi:uncharacterized protein
MKEPPMHPDPIIAAIQSGDKEKVRDLLAQDPSAAAARNEKGVSAIMLALYMRREEILELLQSASITLDIFEATSLGKTERIAELVKQDRSAANARSADGFTALHFAAFFGQEAAAHLLLENRAQPDAVANNPMKVMPLHSAAAGQNLAIVRDLLEHGAPAGAKQEAGWTALHEAAQSGDKQMVELLLKHGADPMAKNDQGITPAQLATEKGHTELARGLQAERNAPTP